eukprot:TRINITY_DN9562_c0_g1_i1.p1 TRINITY_DN9562_c0_g1~~TRINITY_DN9562_c0_g1_i1.p1  ORF type:complete len:280 (-),score=78.12 TRINITY_DN9562_c0_g1_i1:83-922(-)
MFDLFDPSSFRWSHDLPLSSPETVLAILAAYFVICFAIRGYVLKFRQSGFNVDTLFVAHNGFLSLFSLVMCVGAAFEVYQRFQQEGIDWFICEDPNTKAQGALYFWSYIYYLSKFYELLDTVFIAVKGSELTFFQMYHHSVVVVMCYLWLEYAQSLQFGGLIFNTAVHVVMYYYFALRTHIKKDVWWKAYVTYFQIVQFMTSAVLFVLVMIELHSKKRACAGENALYFNFVFNMSLLYQFFGLLGGKKSKKSKGVGKEWKEGEKPVQSDTPAPATKKED